MLSLKKPARDRAPKLLPQLQLNPGQSDLVQIKCDRCKRFFLGTTIQCPVCRDKLVSQKNPTTKPMSAKPVKIPRSLFKQADESQKGGPLPALPPARTRDLSTGAIVYNNYDEFQNPFVPERSRDLHKPSIDFTAQLPSIKGSRKPAIIEPAIMIENLDPEKVCPNGRLPRLASQSPTTIGNNSLLSVDSGQKSQKSQIDKTVPTRRIPWNEAPIPKEQEDGPNRSVIKLLQLIVMQDNAQISTMRQITRELYSVLKEGFHALDCNGLGSIESKVLISTGKQVFGKAFPSGRIQKFVRGKNNTTMDIVDIAETILRIPAPDIYNQLKIFARGSSIRSSSIANTSLVDRLQGMLAPSPAAAPFEVGAESPRGGDRPFMKFRSMSAILDVYDDATERERDQENGRSRYGRSKRGSRDCNMSVSFVVSNLMDVHTLASQNRSPLAMTKGRNGSEGGSPSIGSNGTTPRSRIKEATSTTPPNRIKEATSKIRRRSSNGSRVSIYEVHHLQTEEEGAMLKHSLMMKRLEKKYQKSTLQEIMQIFRLYDKDGDGYVTMDDIKSSFQSQWARDQCEDIFKDGDKNQNGKLDLEEFAELVQAAYAGKDNKTSPGLDDDDIINA